MAPLSSSVNSEAPVASSASTTLSRGRSSSTNLRPSGESSTPPTPRIISPQRTFAGAARSAGSRKPVGCTCTRSMSTVPAPIAIAIFMPSPVAHGPFVVGKRSKSGRCFSSSDVSLRSFAKPPVARTVSVASSDAEPPAASVYATPTTAPAASVCSAVARQPRSSRSAPFFSKRFTSRARAKVSSAPTMPFAGRCVRGYEWPPNCATRERSMPVLVCSHSIADADEDASSAMRPPLSRLALRAVSLANASTESAALASPRECGGQQPLIPDDALAELPPSRRSLSISATVAPLSSSRSAAVSPATPEPMTTASSAGGAGGAAAAATVAGGASASSGAKDGGRARAACRCVAKRGALPKCFASSRRRASSASARRTASASRAASMAPPRTSDATAPRVVSSSAVATAPEKGEGAAAAAVPTNSAAVVAAAGAGADDAAAAADAACGDAATAAAAAAAAAAVGATAPTASTLVPRGEGSGCALKYWSYCSAVSSLT
mmetsp:Transcript_25375/g.73117  ORF Transcript_25375/g.73117 Transcript_25375/m.73117 type:complete len:494 (+) Transcript_25375:583-2064(+)